MSHPETGDSRAVIEGRPRAGLVAWIVGALGCSFALLAVDLVRSVESSARSAAPFLIALPLALLPVPFLIALVLLLDRLEPEPRANLVFAFVWGAGIAALLAAVINTAGLVFITQPDLGKSTGEYVSATFGAPVVEETLKGSVLFWLLWRRRQELDGPTDGIIYAAMVGLGFAMMENIGYYMGALVRPVLGGVQLLGVTFVFRGILAPFAHPAFTAMTGIGAAYAASHRRGGWALPAGLLAAMVLHGLWNGLTVFGPGGIVLAYGMLACVVTGLLAVVVADRRRMVKLIWQFLPTYTPTGLVTDADLQMLCSLRRRRQARRWARAEGGRRGARAMADYQLAATELALVHLRAQRQAIEAGSFADRRQALVGLMASARAAFFRDPGQPICLA
jgi:RsiW-degrading membrane proteinase PrsW (M82 family)